MIAGTLVALGRLAPGAGRWLKRGSIVALGGIDTPASYRYACTYQPPHVKQILTHLRTRYGVPVTPAQIGGHYRRYSGDMSELGRGEILEWTTG
jgi:formylmethanofuran dehydrogenase subunit C